MPLTPDKTLDVLAVYNKLDEWCDGQDTVVTCIESVHGMPGQGISSTFKFGKTTGQVDALLQLFSNYHVEITPQSWKKHYNLKGKNKEQAVSLALSHFPNMLEVNTLQEGYINKERQSGIADALLMGLYCYNTYQFN